MMTTIASTSGLLSSAPDFEKIYADANGDPARIPWEDGQAHPALVTWLNAVAPSLVRCGSRVAVVGCGLGDDARALIHRGYDVTAFDCSESAIDWARRIDPSHADSYVVADLGDFPARWRHRFDLVVEVNTIQSISPERHVEVLRAMADLLAAHGHLLVVGTGRSESTADSGPPWPLDASELEADAACAGLVCDDGVSSFVDDQVDPPRPRVRGLFRRA
jgi:SAM-dependent methyltransferase